MGTWHCRRKYPHKEHHPRKIRFQFSTKKYKISIHKFHFATVSFAIILVFIVSNPRFNMIINFNIFIYKQHLLLAWTWAHGIRLNRHACQSDINTHSEATLCNHFTIFFIFLVSFSIFSWTNFYTAQYSSTACSWRWSVRRTYCFPERNYDLIPSERLFQVWVQLMHRRTIIVN